MSSDFTTLNYYEHFIFICDENKSDGIEKWIKFIHNYSISR
jgi:hypothetical protein